MKKLKQYIAFTTVMAMMVGQVQAQNNCCPPPADCCAPVDCCQTDCCPAYCDSEQASYLAAALPIGALIVAAIIIATTDNHHHHHSSSSSSSHYHGGSCR